LGIPTRTSPHTQENTDTIEKTNEAADRITVGGDVQRAKLINRVPPYYPEGARKYRITGTVRIHAIIDKQGFVSEMSYVDGPCILAEAAFRAVAQWRFKPTMLRGVPIEVDSTFDVKFNIR
jgi:TonB family protein